MYNVDLDQMSQVMALDNASARDLQYLAPHMNMMSMNEPRKLSNAATFPKPVAATINNWLYSPCEVVSTNEQEKFMNGLRA